MANVLEILIAARDEATTAFQRATQASGVLGNALRALKGTFDVLGGSSAKIRTDLDGLTKTRVVRLDSQDVERMKKRVEDLDKALQPQRLQAKIQALTKELNGPAGPGATGILNTLGRLNTASVGGLVTSLASLNPVALAAAGAVAALGASVRHFISEAAAAQEEANKLGNALASSGQYSTAARDHILALAASMQKLTTQSDEAVTAAASVLAQIGRLSGGELDRATKASLDLAAGLGVDLSNAAFLVAKAAAGSTAMLGRYGIVLDEGMPKAQKFAAALAQIESKFGGSAAAAAQTYQGSVKQLTNAMSDLAEIAGKPFLQPLIDMMKGATAVARGFNDALTGGKGSAETFEEGLDSLASKFLETKGKTAAAYFELKRFRELDVTKNIDFEIRGGDLAEVERHLQAIVGTLTILRGIQDPGKGVAGVISELDTLRQKMADGIALRVKVQKDDAARDLLALENTLKPTATVKARLAFDTEAFRATLAAAQGRFTVAPYVDEAAFLKSLQTAEGRAEKLAEIKARLQLEIPKASIDDMLAQADKLQERFKAAVDLPDSDPNKAARIEQATATMREFARLASARYRVLVEVDGIEALEGARRAMEKAASGGRVKLIDPDDLANSKSLSSEFEKVEAALNSLIAAGKTGVAAEAFNDLMQKLEDLKTKIPERASELKAMQDTLAAGFKTRIEVAVDTDKAKQGMTDLKAAMQAFLAVDPSKVEQLDLSRVIQQAQTAEQVMKAAGEALSAALATGDLSKAIAAWEALGTVAAKIGANPNVSGETKEQLVAMRDEADRAVQMLKGLEALPDIEKQFRLRVALGQFKEAERELGRLKKLAAEDPGNLELKVDIRQMEAALKKAREDAAKTTASIGEAFRAAGDQVLKADLPNVVAGEFSQMILEGQSFQETMVGIFKSMADAIIQQLIRVLVWKVIVGIATAGTGAVAGPAPGIGGGVPGPGGTVRGKASGDSPPPPPPLPKVALTPEVSVRPLAPIELSPDVAVRDLPPITLTQGVDVRPLQPITLAPALQVKAPAGFELGLEIAAREPEPVQVSPKVTVNQPDAVRLTSRLTVAPPAPLAVKPVFRPQAAADLLVRPVLAVQQPPPADVAARVNVSDPDPVEVRARASLAPLAPLTAIQGVRLERLPEQRLRQPVAVAPLQPIGLKQSVQVDAPAPARPRVKVEAPPESTLKPRVRLGPMPEAVLTPKASLRDLPEQTIRAPRATIEPLDDLTVPAPNIVAPEGVSVRLALSVPEVPPISLARPEVRLAGRPQAPFTVRAPEVVAPKPSAPIRLAAPAVDQKVSTIRLAPPRVIQAEPPNIRPTFRPAASEGVAARVPASGFTPPPRAGSPGSPFPTQAFEGALRRFGPQGGPVRAPSGVPSVLEFSRRAANLAGDRVRLPNLPTVRDREDAGVRVRRFFRGQQAAPQVVEATINALDASSFERYMRAGNGAKTMAALSRTGRV